jgi:GT2 family glycosyltransferase
MSEKNGNMEIALGDLAFIIVLYNCELLNAVSIKSLLTSKLAIQDKINLIVYDNSPDRQHINELTKINLLTYFHDKSNAGVSRAYNYGVAFASKMNFKWVVLLDQDTVFQNNFIDKVLGAINCNPELKLFAPILRLKNGGPFSPTRYRLKRGHDVNLQEGVWPLKKYSPVNSGLVINVNAFQAVGGYLDEVRLDFADFQFIERFREEYASFYLLNSVGEQDFSNHEKDLNKLGIRFAIFCDCAKKCKRYSPIDSFGYFYTVLRHTFGLFLKTKSFSFFKIAYLNYFK